MMDTEEKHAECVWTETRIIINVKNLGDQVLGCGDRLGDFVEAICIRVVAWRRMILMRRLDVDVRALFDVGVVKAVGIFGVSRLRRVIQLNALLAMDIGVDTLKPWPGRHDCDWSPFAGKKQNGTDCDPLALEGAGPSSRPRATGVGPPLSDTCQPSGSRRGASIGALAGPWPLRSHGSGSTAWRQLDHTNAPQTLPIG